MTLTAHNGPITRLLAKNNPKMDDFIVDGSDDESDYSLSDEEQEEPVLTKRKQQETRKERGGKKTRLAEDSIYKMPHAFIDMTERGTYASIVGRDAEVAKVVEIFQSANSFRPLLMGPLGIGKREVVWKFAHFLKTAEAPAVLKDRKVIEIDCKTFLGDEASKHRYADSVITLRREITSLISLHKNPIFYFRDVHEMLDIEFKSFFSMLFQSKIPIICSVDEEVHDVLSLGFKKIVVNECSRDEVKAIVAQMMPSLKIAEEALDLTIELSDAYIKNAPNPMKTLMVLERAQLDAKSSKIEKSHIAHVMEEITGIPASRITASTQDLIQRIKTNLNAQVIGQSAGIEKIMPSIRNFIMGINDPKKPIGVFFIAGPTGVGKTELAKVLSKELFNSENRLIRFNMNHFTEPHSISRIIGAPPGYVGYENGGSLANELMANPHAVVLLDEIEKAHDEVRKIFLTMFDEAEFKDSRERVVNCSKVIFILTSNLCSQQIVELGGKKKVSAEEVLRLIEPQITEFLSGELRGRLTEVVSFCSVEEKHLSDIVALFLKQIKERVEPKITLTWTADVIAFLRKQFHNSQLGIRHFKNDVEKLVLDAIATAQKPNVVLCIQKNELVSK